MAVLLAVQTGCSWIALSGPPSEPPQAAALAEIYADPPCTRSRLAPTLDAVAAVTYGLVAGASAIAATHCAGEGGCDYAPEINAVVFGLAALGFGSSAWYGVSRTAACRRWLDGAIRPTLQRHDRPQ